MPKANRRRSTTYNPTSNEVDAFEQSVARIAGTVWGMQPRSLHRLAVSATAMSEAVTAELYRRLKNVED